MWPKELRQIIDGKEISGVSKTKDRSLRWADPRGIQFPARSALVIAQSTGQEVAVLQRTTVAMGRVGHTSLLLTCSIALRMAERSLKPIRQIPRR